MNAVAHEAGPLTLIEPQGEPAHAIAERQAAPLAIPEQSPAGMMLAAMSRGASLEQVEKMMDLQERWEKREAEKAFVSAMAEFKKVPLTIVKRKRVGYETKDGEWVGYSHAELSDITDVVTPVMAQHGLSSRWDIKQENGRVKVSCIVTHRLGHSEVVTMDGAPDSSGKKNAIQQAASTVTYLQRYTLLAALGMSTKGADDDGAGGSDTGRAEWLQSWLNSIANARNVGELRRVVAEAIKEAESENDQDAKDRFLVAQADKMARAQVPAATTQQSTAQRAAPARTTPPAEDDPSDGDIPY